MVIGELLAIEAVQLLQRLVIWADDRKSSIEQLGTGNVVGLP